MASMGGRVVGNGHVRRHSLRTGLERSGKELRPESAELRSSVDYQINILEKINDRSGQDGCKLTWDYHQRDLPSNLYLFPSPAGHVSQT